MTSFENVLQSLNKSNADLEMDEISFDDSSILDISLNIEVIDNNNRNGTSSSQTPLPMSSTPKKKHYACKECQYITSSGNLSRHKCSVHRKEKVNCTLCNKSYSSAYDINQHIRAHHNQTKLLCELCSGRFNNRTTLARHRRIHHSGQNRFICDRCGKQYFERAVYIGHMNKHIGSRPFACTTCDRTFRFKNNLRRHLQTCPNRTGKRPLECDLCEAKVNSKASLNEHMKGKHGPKTLTCVCGKSFSWRPSFRRHKKKCKFANP